METPDRHGMKLWLLDFADRHPINAAIAAMVLQVTPKAAAVWLRRQEEAGKLKCVGTMKNAKGRKVTKVFCNGWVPKEDNLAHAIKESWYVLLFPQFEFERGHRLGNCYADLIQTNGGRRLEVEMELGTIKKREKIQGRIRMHMQCDCDLLIVAASSNSERRLTQLMEWTEGIRDGVFFTTLERLQTSGAHARVWDYHGRGNGPMKRVPPAITLPSQPSSADTPQVVDGQEENDAEVSSDLILILPFRPEGPPRPGQEG